MKQINTYINEKLRLSAKHQYTCQPKNRDELQDIIIDRIKNEGNQCDLNDIDTSKMTHMAYLFDATENEIFEDFNGDISMWNVSNVINMNYMFYECGQFNCDISQWNVSNVENINHMFYGCNKFKCDLSGWDVTNVKYMKYAFKYCSISPTWYDRDIWEW